MKYLYFSVIVHLVLIITGWAGAIVPIATKISVVQGSGSASPLVGNSVTIQGVVVGDFQEVSELKGFFVQEEDVDADADPLTSEGIFVYDNGFGVAVNVGDQVSVTGEVAELSNLTEITNVGFVFVVNTGNILPTSASITLPLSSPDEQESYEGMRVTLPQELVVNENYFLGRYGQVMLSTKRNYQFTEQNSPNVAGYTAHKSSLNLDSIVVDDSTTTSNPDPISWPGFVLTSTNTIRNGDAITGLSGVLSYVANEYVVHPTDFVNISHHNLRSSLPPAVRGDLKVAGFNTLNYFSTIDSLVLICGPASNQGCRGADSINELSRQRDKIVSTLAAIDADIIGLMEIENHVGDAALADLLSSVNAMVGAGTYSLVSTGPIGTDVIKVALIYKSAVVSPVGGAEILDSTVDATFNDTKNRPSLAQTFQHTATGEVLTVVVNHFKSKGSDCDGLGDPDLGDGQGNCNLTRTAAAAALVNWLETDPTGSGDSDFLIVGDLNSYSKEDPLTAIKSAGYTDLLGSNLKGSSYSFVYSGESGHLDHALSSVSLTKRVSNVVIWHINADEPQILDYNDNFKSPGQITSLYSADAFRSSDHDPIIIGVDLGNKSSILYLMQGVLSGRNGADN